MTQDEAANVLKDLNVALESASTVIKLQNACMIKAVEVIQNISSDETSTAQELRGKACLGLYVLKILAQESRVPTPAEAKKYFGDIVAAHLAAMPSASETKQ